MSDITRRDFLASAGGTSSLALLTAGLAPGLFAGNLAVAEGAKSDRPPVRMAVMGVNGRGRGILSGFAAFPEVEIAYICDPDQNTWAPAVGIVEKAGKRAPKAIKDFRQALDDREVTVLACAAPDHWHALATIWGCQAGKDVYVEKPCSQNALEGQRMIEIARKHKRVVQVGTQRRSAESLQLMISKLREGAIGKVHFARAWITSQRPNIGTAQVTPAPANLDFDLWCGPGPNKGYKKNLVHYHWHWRWDYGTGECGNNGIHALDLVRAGLGIDFPEMVTCGGGKHFFDDDQETPDTQLATFEAPGVSFTWEHRTWAPRGIEGETFGIIFYGTKGTLVTNGNGFTIYEGSGKKEKVVEKNDGGPYEKPHLQNFLDCLITRDKPNADVEIGHRSAMLCHLANIAWRTRSTVKFDPKTETILNNPAATALLTREYRKGYELPTG